MLETSSSITCVERKLSPRHGDGDWEKLGQRARYTDPVYVIKLYNNFSDRIELYSTDNDTLAFLFRSSGGQDTVAYDAAGIIAGTTYLVEIEYNSTDCTLSIDGVIKATSSPAGGIDFGADIPDTAYMGTEDTNVKHSDAVFAAP